MGEWVCINGQLLSADTATVSVFDAGFMQGVGLFETMRTHNGDVFRLEQHLERLIHSARRLGWTAIPTEGELRDNIRQVIEASDQEALRVRLTVTTGTVRPVEEGAPKLTIVATASPGASYPQEIYQKGVSVVLCPYRQSRSDPTGGHKTTSYFGRLAGLRYAHARGAFEALWLTDEEALAEGSISNVFMVANEQLVTPPLATPVLPGVTRAVVLELAAKLRISTAEREFSGDDLLAADEVFLTSSLMELVPVVRVERHGIGTEKPGEWTQRLHQAYRQLVTKECGVARTDEA